ncbi:MAG: hypothetical protein AB1778_01660 [Candidatus Bipolaricaulota bacterium]
MLQAPYLMVEAERQRTQERLAAAATGRAVRDRQVRHRARARLRQAVEQGLESGLNRAELERELLLALDERGSI